MFLSLHSGRTLSALIGIFLGLSVGVPHVGAQQTPLPSDFNGAVIDSIRIVGNEAFIEGAVIGTIGITPGQRVVSSDIQRGVRRLWDTGRYADIVVTVEGEEPGPIVLVFQLEEHPIIRSLAIRGLTRLREEQVWSKAAIEAGVPFSPSKVATAKSFILDELSRRGIPFSHVVVERNPAVGGGIALVLDVTEGLRVSVAQVVIHGNDTFDDATLQGVMATRAEGFLWNRPGSYDRLVLEGDLIEGLPSFYRSEGYLDVEVVGDTMIVDPETGKARLEVEIVEGPRYRLESFDVVGSRAFPSQDLQAYYSTRAGGLLRALGLRGGDSDSSSRPIFDEVAFLDGMERVATLYRNAGYLYSNLSPQIERLPPEQEGEDPRVAVRWNVEEGRQAIIRSVSIEGNEYTHDWVIRDRITSLPGDVYSEERLIRSYQAISALGFFETPMPQPGIFPDEVTGDVDITFRVVEKRTGEINFGTTMGGYGGIAGFIGYSQPNLFGQGKSGSLRWDFGRYQNNFTTSYTDPSLFQSRISGTISLFNSRDRFFTFASGDRKLRGGSVRLGIPFPGSYFSRIIVGYSLSRTDYRLRSGVDDTSLFGRPAGVQSQVSLGISRQTLDHPLFPTTGSEQTWTVQVNGGLLGGDADFVKHRVTGSWWIPVARIGGNAPDSRPIVTSLGLKTRFGAVFGNADRFPFDRYWLGGVQFGESLRGYGETSITPLGYFSQDSRDLTDVQRLGDAFFAIGAEYAIRFSDAISVSAFLDAGNIWRNPADIDPSRLLRGAGFGGTVVTPFGPLGLDLAFGFDRPDRKWEFHFTMGGQGM